jgi:ABC-2 type transport system ATP-binding protein
MYGHLSGVENLEYFAALGGQPLTRSELLVRLADVGLSDGIAAARASTYSRGMRQRFRRVRTHVYAMLLTATRRPGAWVPPRLNRQWNRLTGMPSHRSETAP